MAQTKAQLVVGLNVNASAPASALQIDASGNVNLDSNTLYVDATNNRVGVGTTSPAGLLHVEGVTGTAPARIVGSSTNSSVLALYNNAATTNRFIVGQGYSSGTDNVAFVQNDANAALVFGTNTAERMRITAAGSVGIGTSSPGIDGLDVTKTGTQLSATGAYVNGRFGDASYAALLGRNATGGVVAGANDLAFYTYNSGWYQRACIDSSGRVGIGTTSPNANLEVNVSGNNAQTRVTSTHEAALWLVNGGGSEVNVINSGGSGNLSLRVGNSERARLDSSGRLLVGTSTNLGSAEGYEPRLQVAGSTQGLSIGRYQANNPYGAQLYLQRSKSDTVGGHAVMASGDEVGYISFEGSDGTAFKRAAAITALVDGTPGTNDMPGRLVFSVTADGQSSPTERFRIASGGQLGIGGANYGTSGQVLTSQGSGAAPQWASASTGNDYNFASGNATGATIDITGIPSNALKIEVIFGGIGWTQTAGFYARVGSGSFQTNGYTWNQGYTGSSTSFSQYTVYLYLNNGFMTTAERIYGKLVLDKRTVNTWGGVYKAMSSNFGQGIMHGVGDAYAGGTLDRIQLGMTAGTFSTGYYTVNVYTE